MPVTTTTDAQGNYLFDGLAPGTYVVRVSPSNFAPGAPLFGYTSSTGALQESDPNASGDQNDNGLDGGDPGNDGIASNPVVLSYDTETKPRARRSRYAADEDSNLTIDFGLFPGEGTDLYAIPTLSQYGLLLMMMLLLGFGVYRVRV